LDSLSEDEQIRVMRANLKPHFKERCTNENLLAATRNPNGPLRASGLCRVQTLHRDGRANPVSGLVFTSELLCRERVQAILWPNESSEISKRSSRSAEPLAAAA
jgi:hypothetical protein